MLQTKKWAVLVLIVVLMVGISSRHASTSTIAIGNHPSNLHQSNVPVPNHYLDNYQISKSIKISADSDFLEYNFTGNGTRSAPYLIENLNITVVSESAISIVNVTKWFIIRNCLIAAKENDFSYLIEIGNASNWVFSHSVIMGANRTNRLDACDNVNITENSFTRLWFGIEFSDSTGLGITDNDFKSIESVGIALSSSVRVHISNNTFNDCKEGIRSSYVSSTIIERNTFSDSIRGIEYYQQTEGLVIRGNIFDNLSSIGISSTSVFAYSVPDPDSPVPPTLTVVRENMLKKCKYGLSSAYSASDLFINNTLLECGTGVFLGDTKYVRIVGNNISCSQKYGIRMFHAHRNLVYSNVVSDSGISNAYDDNGANVWDDMNSTGNCWSDYNGTTLYRIPGTSRSFDRWPRRCGPPHIVLSVEQPVVLRTESMNVSWWAYDSDPLSYSIHMNGKEVYSSAWDGSNITLSLQGYGPGEYNVTATVRDKSGHFESSSVLVTIETNTNMIIVVGVVVSVIGVVLVLQRRLAT
jgi:parallel beta-helix repeat protein